MKKWEYKTIKIDAKSSFMGGKFDEVKFQDSISKEGELGWELVNVFPINKGYGSTESVILIFKKEIE